MKIVKYIVLIVATILLAYFTAGYFWKLYDYLFPGVITDGSFIGTADAFGQLFALPLAYIFFLTLLLTAFGGQTPKRAKYWVMGVLLIPAVVFEIYFDWQHIYIPVIIGLLGFLVGLLINNIYIRYAKSS